MRINAVFEGGGVKAIALVGAVKAAEEYGVTFNQMAGTSSGSIVAALLTAGYNADEMRDIIIETPFQQFLRKGVAEQTRKRRIAPLIRLMFKKGLYSGQELEEWIRKLLADKGLRRFGELDHLKRLRIIASDITNERMLVLPDDIRRYQMEPERLEIAKAIRMSTSIPFFFEPVVLRKPIDQNKSSKQHKFRSNFVYVVDGAILSNFPLWLFDREQSGVKELVPTIGFQLVGRSDTQTNDICGPISMLQALFSTMMGAHDERYIEKVNRFRTIKIPTLGVKTTDFHISNEMSMKLYNSGLMAGRDFFKQWTTTAYLEKYQQYVRMQRGLSNLGNQNKS